MDKLNNFRAKEWNNFKFQNRISIINNENRRKAISR